ncbi:MAG: cytochrome C [Vicinamibacterales bacterium]
MTRTFATAALAAGLALTWSVGYVRAAEDAIDKDLLHRIKIGYAIAPVPLDLAGRNRLLVGLGSYIVNAQGGCNDCHTNPPYADGGNPFVGEPERVNQAAYLGGGVTFGPFVSRNLTPNRLGLPAGLTLEQFGETMRTGRDLKNRPPAVPSEALDLLQVMPWPVYAHMNDRDLKAVYEYLRAIPCVGSATRCTP